MRIAVVLALCITLPRLVAADPAPPPRDVTRLIAGDCERARKAGKTCVLDLPAEDIAGDHARGSDFSFGILTFGTQASLIRVRHDFIPEIVKTAEDL